MFRKSGLCFYAAVIMPYQSAHCVFFPQIKYKIHYVLKAFAADQESNSAVGSEKMWKKQVGLRRQIGIERARIWGKGEWWGEEWYPLSECIRRGRRPMMAKNGERLIFIRSSIKTGRG